MKVLMSDNYNEFSMELPDLSFRQLMPHIEQIIKTALGEPDGLAPGTPSTSDGLFDRIEKLERENTRLTRKLQQYEDDNVHEMIFELKKQRIILRDAMIAVIDKDIPRVLEYLEQNEIEPIYEYDDDGNLTEDIYLEETHELILKTALEQTKKAF